MGLGLENRIVTSVMVRVLFSWLYFIQLMERLFEYFLKIFTFPRHFTLSGVIHVLLVICGILVLYLLTLREDEEGKLEDYLQRLMNRIHQLRERALSFHLAFINVTAAILSSILDKVFGRKLVSLQSLGVMLALSLFFTNVYFIVAGIQTSDFAPDQSYV